MRRIPRTLVLLLLLAYSGQAFLVAASPCAMMSGPASDMSHDMSAIDHTGHDMPMQMDAAAVAAETHPVFIAAMPGPTFNAPQESPYRPPISA